MPLISTILSNAFKDIFEGTNGFPADEDEAGKKWAKAYQDYAANALAATTAPLAPSLDAAESTLAGSIAGAFSTAKEAGATALSALGPTLDGAFVAFWLAPPVAFAIPPTGPPAMTGIVTLAPPGVLSPLLITAFQTGAAPGVSAADQATNLAGILDTWTRTVMVINTPVTPPGPPLPPVPLT